MYNLSEYMSWIYELDPARFFSALGLAWWAAFKKTKVKLNLLTDIDMIIMVEKGIQGGHAICRFVQGTTNIWKIMIKTKNHYIQNIGI